jgi:hypothetical protein
MRFAQRIAAAFQTGTRADLFPVRSRTSARAAARFFACGKNLFAVVNDARQVPPIFRQPVAGGVD